MSDSDKGNDPVVIAEVRIDSAFRNGSITALSVMVGFSLSFLARWAGLPGSWERLELVVVATISIGIAFEIVAMALLLSFRSLLITRYNRAVVVFLIGLAFVVAGVAIAIVSDIMGIPQQVLRG